jgi:hypothetical protein
MMSSSAGDRRRIERKQKITTVVVTVLLLAAVVGLVIWITSHFGHVPGIVLLVFLESESSQSLMGSLSDIGDLRYLWM